MPDSATDSIMTLRHASLVFLLWSSLACAESCVKTRDVSFDDFMDHSLSVSIPLTIPMPVAYQHAPIEGAPSTYSYWMLPGETDSVQKTGDMPVKTGYVYGKISTDVGYDQSSDTFSGSENMKQQLEGHGLHLISSERIKVNGYAIMLMQIMFKAKNMKIYSMYVGTNAGTSAVYVNFHPPANDIALGDCYWQALKSTLLASANNGPSPPAPTPALHGDDDLSSGLALMKTSENQDGFIAGFATAAHDGRIDSLLGMMAPSVRTASGDEAIKANLRDVVVPFFAKYTKVHSYTTVTRAALPDGRSGTWFFTYIVDDTDKPKPFRIAVIEEGGSLRVAFIEVGKCIQGRHPFCN